MPTSGEDQQERRVARETLIRLANSCERAAARGKAVTPLAADLDEDDYKTIADILRGMAKVVS